MKLTPFIVLTVAWILNAMMDAIDHGKGAKTLNLLWHVIKWLSYAVPGGYIFLISGIPHATLAWTLPIFLVVLTLIWESLYRFLRHINFGQYDK
jgi:hypothetical protein